MKRIIVCAAGTWNVRDQRDKLNWQASTDKCHQDSQSDSGAGN
jgi:hypothetical protein